MSSLSRGKDTELKFSRHLTNVIWSTKQEDMKAHWDLKGSLNGSKIFKFDVKGLRGKSRRGGIDPSVLWIESKNVNGDKGWLYGEADYIVFEQLQSWIVVKRLKIIPFIRSKLKHNNYERVYRATDALYRIYTRKNRSDLLSMALIEDIKHIMACEIPKSLTRGQTRINTQ